jgi:hypothetical protein
MARKNEEGSQLVGQSIPVQDGGDDGFQRSGSAAAVGWFNMAKIGNTLRGKLTGMYTRKDGLREEGSSKFFQVQLDVACEVRAERGEEAKFITANPGDFVNVNYGPKTKPWENFIASIENGAVYLVKGTILGEKVKIGTGRKMHNFETMHKMVTPPREHSSSDPVGEVFEEEAAS